MDGKTSSGMREATRVCQHLRQQLAAKIQHRGEQEGPTRRAQSEQLRRLRGRCAQHSWQACRTIAVGPRESCGINPNPTRRQHEQMLLLYALAVAVMNVVMTMCFCFLVG